MELLLNLQPCSHIFGPDALVFMEFLETLNLAVKLPSSKFDVKLDNPYAHYIPNVRTSPPLLECQPTSLHFLRSVNRPMLHLTVLFVRKFLQDESSSDRLEMLPHKLSNNITHFRVFPSTAANEGIKFNFVYLGEAIEFRLPVDNKNKEICLKIISVCKDVVISLNLKNFQYNFAIMCHSKDGSDADRFHRVRHLLPLKRSCEDCCFSLDEATDAIKTWNSVIKENKINDDHKLNGAPLTPDDVKYLSVKMSKLSTEGANALAKSLGCKEEFEVDSDENNKWRVFMSMILQWEKSPDPSIKSPDSALVSKKELRSKKELAMIMCKLSEDLNAKLSYDDSQLLMEMSASIDLTVSFKRAT